MFLWNHNCLYNYMPIVRAIKGLIGKKVPKNFVKINNYLSPEPRSTDGFYLWHLPQDLAALTSVEYFRDGDKRLPFWPGIKMVVKMIFFYENIFSHIVFCLGFSCFKAHQNAQNTIITLVHLKRNLWQRVCVHLVHGYKL